MKRRVSCATAGWPILSEESRGASTAQKNISATFLSFIYSQFWNRSLLLNPGLNPRWSDPKCALFAPHPAVLLQSLGTPQPLKHLRPQNILETFCAMKRKLLGRWWPQRYPGTKQESAVHLRGLCLKCEHYPLTGVCARTHTHAHTHTDFF